VRCEVERALARSRKKGVTRGVAGATGVTGVPAHQPSSSTSSEGRELCVFFFLGIFSRSFSVLLHSGLVFFGTFYLLFAAHKTHIHIGARTSGRKKKI